MSASARLNSNDNTKYVELSVEDFWTRVRFPPPPPLFLGFIEFFRVTELCYLFGYHWPTLNSDSGFLRFYVFHLNNPTSQTLLEGV